MYSFKLFGNFEKKKVVHFFLYHIIDNLKCSKKYYFMLLGVIILNSYEFSLYHVTDNFKCSRAITLCVSVMFGTFNE